MNLVDPNGESTWVKQVGDNQYEVIGGDLSDGDYNVYVGGYTDEGDFIKLYSIGETTSMTSFYDSDVELDDNHTTGWCVGAVINLEDQSGNIFLQQFVDNSVSLQTYIPNARKNHKYDFKVTNGSEEVISNSHTYVYRGMPISYSTDGKTKITSARDVGNIAAGYIAAKKGISWGAARKAFDTYQRGKEGISTQSAQLYGWTLGAK